MKKILFFFLLLSFVYTNAQITGYQTHLNSTPPVVYNSNVNIRALPSLKSKIVNTLATGEALVPTYNNRKEDTINGIASYWQEIKFKGIKAYIWNDLVAKAAFKLQTNTDYKLLIKQESENSIGIKIFLEDTFIKHQQIQLSSSEELIEAISIGTTYNSNGKEIIAFVYSNNNIVYYQWDSEVLIPFNKELPVLLDTNRNWIYSIAKNVNIREAPNLTSSILATAQLGDKLTLIKSHYKKDTVNTIVGSWSKIKYQNKEAYVWDKLTSHKGIESTKTKGVLFIITTNGLTAVQNGEILDVLPLSDYGADDLVPLGNLGIHEIQEFIGCCIHSESCGQSSGDVIYSWNGKKFKHFVDAIGVGDGGLSEGDAVIFPSFINGTKNTINIISSNSESIDTPSADMLNTSYDYFDRENLKRTYTITKDLTLLEASSRTSKITAFLTQNFSNYKLNYFKALDFNNDNNEDVIVYATKKKYDTGNTSIIIILQGNNLNEYKTHSFNKKIIVHDENDPLTDVVIHKNGFSLNIYYAGYYTHPYENCVLKMHYKYVEDMNDFKLTKEVKMTPNTNDSSWSRNVTNYKKNTILFKNSWHSELSLSSE